MTAATTSDGDGEMIPVASTRAGDQSVDATIPLFQEHAVVSTREVTTGRVRISSSTETFEEVVNAALHSDVVDVTRVQIGTPVTGPVPQTRTEGDVTIVPVLEETLVVEKRLILKEELHIRRRDAVETVEVPVTLRRQRADVLRTDDP